jgi:hypothetical protein
MAYPSIVNDVAIYSSEVLSFRNFQSALETHHHDIIVRETGYTTKSEWWLFNKTLAECIQTVTGCLLGDVACAERHAFKRLVRGPFKEMHALIAEKLLIGIPESLKLALLRLPLAYAPRIDISIHLRNQFHHFENEVEVSDPAYVREVSDFLNGTECSISFEYFEKEVIRRLKEIRSNREISDSSKNQKSNPIYMYIAGDNHRVKEALAHRLLMHPDLMTYQIFIIRVNATKVVHIKDAVKFKGENDTLLVSLVFDWHALSLSNTILAWRRAFTSGISTFVMSAQKMSGTRERSDREGSGTKGYQLIKDRRGNVKFEQFWSYSIITYD